jgi:hypothetical protein
VQVGNSVFRLPVTAVQFINKSSLFILLLNVIRHAGTEADAGPSAIRSVLQTITSCPEFATQDIFF